jgi:hypothetical protein
MVNCCSGALRAMGRKEGGLGGIPSVCGFAVFFCLRGALVVVLVALAFPCILIGLLAMPLCGAALTFFAAAKKVSKESGLATASL